MARVIHRAISDGQQTVAVVHTESGGGNKWEKPALLSSIRLDNDKLEDLFKGARIISGLNITAIESNRVDARNQGPKSGYGRKLDQLLKDLPTHLKHEPTVSKDNLIEQEISNFRAESQRPSLELNTPDAPAKFPNINDDSVLASAVTEPSITARRPMRL